MFGTWITSQLVFDGVVSGLVIGLLAMGIVLVYRATRVINFAVGSMGLVGASLLPLLVVNYNVPFWLAAVAALVVGTLFGTLMELVVIRRLFTAPRVIVLVATTGISGLALAITFAYPKLDQLSAAYPAPTDDVWYVAGIRIAGPQLSILVAVPLVALALGWLLNRTLVGRTVKASAENPDLARLQGINPKVVSTAVWSVAGLVATLTMMLIAAQIGSASDLVTLGPSTLVRALLAAVIARMTSFPWAMLAGVAIGLVQALVNFNYLDKPGLIDALLFVAVLVAVALHSRSAEGIETQTFSFAPKVREIPDRLRDLWWVRRLNLLSGGTLLTIAIVVPLLVTQSSKHLLYATIVCFAISALSLTVLTGWAGQLSLGQMAFAGIGALLAAQLHKGLDLDLEVVHFELGGLPFVLSIVIAALAMAALAALIGAGAVRVRGLMLAVSTIAFALAAQNYVYRQPLLGGDTGTPPSFERGTLFGLDLTSQRTYYYFVLGVLVGAVVCVGRLRRTGIGRTTIAVRDNADTASAYTVRGATTKLRAFALAGGLAGLGGALLAGALATVPATEQFFLVQDSLLLVSIAVIGGISTPMGAVIGSLWVIGLPTFFADSQVVPLLVSSVGLLVLLLYFPGGLMQIAYSVRDALLGWAEKRVQRVPTTRRVETPPMLTRNDRPPMPDENVALEASDLHVRFGGIVAVDGASLTVAPNEIVGLIGTNGAGKSTFMNAIGGFVRANGTIRLHRDDVSRLTPAKRASMGLGRTFQAARLFPELTVRETVEVALEARGRTGFLATALVLPHATSRERARRSHADDLIGFLGLGRYADTRVAELSTGTRRLVELAGLLALDARVLCLDEPTAGVAQRETEAFGPLLQEVRRELGAAMLVIEHDMPLIMSISDRVYCLELGRVIAEGLPDTVRQNAKVVASYLGTDERAIARSGASATAVRRTVAPPPRAGGRSPGGGSADARAPERP